MSGGNKNIVNSQHRSSSYLCQETCLSDNIAISDDHLHFKWPKLFHLLLVNYILTKTSWISFLLISRDYSWVSSVIYIWLTYRRGWLFMDPYYFSSRGTTNSFVIYTNKRQPSEVKLVIKIDLITSNLKSHLNYSLSNYFFKIIDSLTICRLEVTYWLAITDPQLFT